MKSSYFAQVNICFLDRCIYNFDSNNLAGWTETTLKYAKYIHFLNNLGYEIYSFDMRGQGFSGLTAWDDGVVTHASSLSDTYVADLDTFISKIVRKANPTKDIIYSGNSFAGQVGLLLQLENPKAFSKIIVYAPCIMPNLDMVTQYGIKFARALGFERFA